MVLTMQILFTFYDSIAVLKTLNLENIIVGSHTLIANQIYSSRGVRIPGTHTARR